MFVEQQMRATSDSYAPAKAVPPAPPSPSSNLTTCPSVSNCAMGSRNGNAQTK